MTSKEKVLAVYPDASLSIFNNRIEIWENKKFFSSCLSILSLDLCFTLTELEEKAWLRAWKQIQEDLIEKMAE